MQDALFLEQIGGPWIFRSGRPFGQAGDAVSLPMPWPTTVAGALRTALGDSQGLDFSNPQNVQTLLDTAVWGALPARHQDGRLTPYYPQPADALYLKPDAGGDPQRHALRPRPLGAGEATDLPDGLWPLFLDSTQKGKPADGPLWWHPQAMDAWLRGDQTPRPAGELGWQGPRLARRTHVCLDPATGAAAESQLFQTQGARFGQDDTGPQGLMAACQPAPSGKTLRLGADGGLARLHAISGGWPQIPPELAEALTTTPGLRLILTTPGLFEGGWRPGWLQWDTATESWQGQPPDHPDIRLRLRAAAVGRWQAISGWDLATQRPRAIRRAVPAGTVYWFEVLEGQPSLPQLWLRPLADRPQDRNDGFGLVLPGLWNMED